MDCVAQQNLRPLPIVADEAPEKYLLPGQPDTANAFFQPSLTNGWICGLFAECMPEFPGGTKRLFAYLKEHIQYPPLAVSSRVSGTVFVGFLVEPDGSVGAVEVLKEIGYGCDEEALRVIMTMPAWKPATLSGKPIAIRYSLPVRFILNEPKRRNRRWFILPFRRTFCR
jgi:TonB family protein